MGLYEALLGRSGMSYCQICSSYCCIHTVGNQWDQQQMSHYNDALRQMAAGNRTVLIDSGGGGSPAHGSLTIGVTTGSFTAKEHIIKIIGKPDKKLLLLRRAT